MLIERHYGSRIGWMRAAVLGANDGLISTSSLVVGVAAAQADHHAVLLSGIAGLAAGSLSMAAGEYVSVSSQADTEKADLAKEREELKASPEAEKEELAQIYVTRGVEPEIARKVAEQMMAKDALGAHARDELGIHEATRARPLQAAIASAASFTAGALPAPLLVALLSPKWITPAIIAVTIVLLLVLGSAAAYLGGAPRWRGALRVVFWGLLAMGCTILIGRWFGTVTG